MARVRKKISLDLTDSSQEITTVHTSRLSFWKHVRACKGSIFRWKYAEGKIKPYPSTAAHLECGSVMR